MKKIISLMAGFAIASCVFSGCVEDSQNVILRGVSSSCEASSEDQEYVVACAMSGNKLSAHVMNYITGGIPWSSSGGSSSGSSYETDIPNAGLIYIDEVTLRCEEVNGEKDGCDGKDPIKIKNNYPVNGSGSGICIPFDTDAVSEWGDNVKVSVQVYYHDSSYISGKTGKVYFTMGSKYGACVNQDDSGDNNGGGDTGNDEDNNKKKSGESCTSNDECASGSCIEVMSPDGMTVVTQCE